MGFKFPRASDTVVAETEFDKTPSAGVKRSYSRGDHTHGTPPTPAAGGKQVDTYEADTSTAWTLAATFADDPVCNITIPKTGKATRVHIVFTGYFTASAAGSQIILRLRIAGSDITNTNRMSTVATANYSLMIDTNYIHSWDGAADLNVVIRASGINCVLYSRCLSILAIY